MANACFRCKARIDSGRTFCEACREEVSLDFSYTAESRTWVAIAVLPVLQVLLLAGAAAAAVLTAGPGDALATRAGAGLAAASPFAFLLSVILAYALLKDASHVSARADTDWEPSGWAYYPLAGLTLLVLPAPFVAAYHLSRRKAAIGLRLRRWDE